MNDHTLDLIVIGGGAAGFFGALRAAEQKPGIKILILEKTNKLLSKVKVSGGGRCNVTHSEFDPIALSSHYPRGEKPLRTVFKTFHARDTVEWFESKNVELKREGDGRMFPITDNSQTIINCFLREALDHKIKIEMGRSVSSIHEDTNGFNITCVDGSSYRAQKILVASGGNANVESYRYIEALGHTIISPIPSLFTFNDPSKKFNDLMGLSVPHAEVKITKTKFFNRGPVLITHWGLSGPAVIKLSAWAAEYLHQQHYVFTVLVNWTGTMTEVSILDFFSEHKIQRGKQKVLTNPMFDVPLRLWQRLCSLAEISDEKIWAELPQRNINKLVEQLIRCPFEIKGKTTFKDEFVTCGGVDLREVDMATMESKKIKNLFFAGEVLNIDGETGGFNFQSAWSTANTAAINITTTRNS
jgi:predicted Rossmann fold flavoprotein